MSWRVYICNGVEHVSRAKLTYTATPIKARVKVQEKKTFWLRKKLYFLYFIVCLVSIMPFFVLFSYKFEI